MYGHRRDEDAARDAGSSCGVEELRRNGGITELELRAGLAPEQRGVEADLVSFECLGDPRLLLEIRVDDSQSRCVRERSEIAG